MDLSKADAAHQRAHAGLKVDGRFVPAGAALLAIREFGSGNLAVGLSWIEQRSMAYDKSAARRKKFPNRKDLGKSDDWPPP